MTKRPVRLIDLHVNWLVQYAPETELYEQATREVIPRLLDQADSYLSTTTAAVINIARTSEDWQSRSDPWQSLGELIARVEAEFSGRLLIADDDLRRWQDDPNGMAWAVLGVGGFDFLIRTAEDVSKLSDLFERGVRVFQLIQGCESSLGGASGEGDEQGLTLLGQACLDYLLKISTTSGSGIPAIDLSGMGAQTLSEVIDWFEADPSRSERLIPLYSHETLPISRERSSQILASDFLMRLRRLRGYLGLTPGGRLSMTTTEFREAVETIAATPFGQEPGLGGICIGTNILGRETLVDGPKTAPEILEWLREALPESVWRSVVHDNAAALLARLAGGTLQA